MQSKQKISDNSVVVKIQDYLFNNQYRESVGYKNLHKNTNGFIARMKGISLKVKKKIDINVHLEMTNILKELAEYTHTLLNDSRPADCEFSIAGLGLYANKTLVPYSIFDYVIILKEKDPLNEAYFDHFQYIFNLFLEAVGLKEPGFHNNLPIIDLKNQSKMLSLQVQKVNFHQFPILLNSLELTSNNRNLLDEFRISLVKFIAEKKSIEFLKKVLNHEISRLSQLLIRFENMALENQDALLHLGEIFIATNKMIQISVCLLEPKNVEHVKSTDLIELLAILKHKNIISEELYSLWCRFNREISKIHQQCDSCVIKYSELKAVFVRNAINIDHFVNLISKEIIAKFVSNDQQADSKNEATIILSDEASSLLSSNTSSLEDPVIQTSYRQLTADEVSVESKNLNFSTTAIEETMVRNTQMGTLNSATNDVKTVNTQLHIIASSENYITTDDKNDISLDNACSAKIYKKNNPTLFSGNEVTRDDISTCTAKDPRASLFSSLLAEYR